LVVAVALALPAGAGELVLEDGTRLQADLAADVLVVVTETGPVEVLAQEVLEVTRDQVRLRDGRVLRGALAGPLAARSALGPLGVRPEDLFRFTASVPGAPPGEPRAAAGRLAGASPRSTALPPPGARVQSAGGGDDIVPDTDPESRGWVEVLTESALLRDAFTAAGRVGRVVRGQQVMLVDFIDRRLRILNTVVFDGGYWIKVRVPGGREGWIPAQTVREIR
jgi:hypothetical protein